MKYFIRSSLLMLTFTIVLGLGYPFLTFLSGQLFFKDRARGSLIIKEGVTVGSSLIGQAFAQDKYFQGRPSKNNYDAMNSGSGNLSLSSKKIYEEIKEREEKYRKSNRAENKILPIDAITSSASGLDPHISKKNAILQAERISEAREMPLEAILALIDAHVEKPFLFLLGSERVNVLLLNLALDEIEKM